MATASSSSISKVAVIRIEILPNEAQEQVYAAVIRMSDDRQSISSLPGAAAALKSEDLYPSNVLAAVINKKGQL